MRLRWLLALMLLIGSAAGSTAARATLLFAGGEDVDFICTNVCTVDTGSGRFRPGWAREAYYANPSTTDPPASYFSTPPFAANSTVWVHGQYWNSGSTGTNNGSQMIRLLDTLGNPTFDRSRHRHRGHGEDLVASCQWVVYRSGDL